MGEILQFLLGHLDSCGPLYNEATLFEERQENYERALETCERGLASMPKYAALWFAKLKLLEKMDVSATPAHLLECTRRVVKEAAAHVSKVLYLFPRPVPST